MSDQPEALRLADDLDEKWWRWKDNPTIELKAAAELRRLHAENETLTAERDALKAAAEKGTEYVLAHINQGLRAERDAAVKALKNALNAIEQHRLHHERGCAYLDGIPETIQAAIDAAKE